MKGKLENRKAITLIALVVTVVVLLILAGVSIAMLTGNSGILTQSMRAKISTELSSYKEELELFKIEQISKNDGFIEGSLTAGKNNLFYNTQEEEEQGKGTIRDIITNISDDYFEKLEVIKGELLINTKDNNEIKVAKSLGIEVNPYDIENGVLLSTGNNLALMDENGTVTVPDNVTEIGAGAFANAGLKTIIIPGTVKKIGANAFSYNTTLETVIMQEGVEEIGSSAFQNCTNLKNVELPESLIKIGEAAFYDCINLQEISIPSKIKNIEVYTFGACTSLSKIELKEGLEEIKGNSFLSTAFSEITIPSTVDTIGSSVFYGNKNLKNIIINKKEGEEAKFVYESGMLMTSKKDVILFASDSYLKSIATFEIPDGVKEYNLNITQYNNIKKIVIPESLESINVGEGIFPSSIEEIEIKGNNEIFAVSNEDKILYRKDTKQLVLCYSKEKIIDLTDEENKIGILSTGSKSFVTAENAETIILPDSLQKIVYQTFTSAFYNLKEIKIGKNVSYIDPLFKYMNYNGKVTIDSGNENYMIENNILYTKKEAKTLVTVLYQINGTFTVDSSVKEIGDRAFHNQTLMTDVIIPDSVTKVGSSFGYCQNLINIVIPKSVESMGGECFNQCNNLNKVTIYNEKLLETAPWGAIKGDKVVDFQV